MTDRVRLSKRMSRVLRHDPARLGLELDGEGWTSVDALVRGLSAPGHPVTRADVEDVVAHGSKQRYELDGDRIRARYGHSVDGRVELPVADPPAVLFHGTGPTTADAVTAEGLRPMGRRFVHLSTDEATARRVGARHGGRPVVFVVDAAAAAAAGVVFRHGNDDTWLADEVPARFLRRPGA
ncbi:RNA 2'-phosphotransferase [Actinomycetospora sp. TBRC 11914]|uniref:RNA 2'-phosphotransferase n=1 Tax=Actinomycetospora sp. TBRC 11914 TaxID=2729387 RepID=UPI00145D4495|nr:RNA 2'-phosphotransferase [Actinomycetospora sp. TBRC 11914]NMO91912.1 RNA 2'-phosphotransferase [Actinomycetospora sp. TBRC 11914]